MNPWNRDREDIQLHERRIGATAQANGLRDRAQRCCVSNEEVPYASSAREFRGRRSWYGIQGLILPVQQSSHLTIMAREIGQLSRDVALTNVGAFVGVLQSIPR